MYTQGCLIFVAIWFCALRTNEQVENWQFLFFCLDHGLLRCKVDDFVWLLLHASHDGHDCSIIIDVRAICGFSE